MAQGLDAVKAALRRDFGKIEIHQDFDIRRREFILSFGANLLLYQVRVSADFDDDYASGQVNIELSRLGPILQASQSGKVRVFSTGIISK